MYKADRRLSYFGEGDPGRVDKMFEGLKQDRFQAAVKKRDLEAQVAGGDKEAERREREAMSLEDQFCVNAGQ